MRQSTQHVFALHSYSSFKANRACRQSWLGLNTITIAFVIACDLNTYFCGWSIRTYSRNNRWFVKSDPQCHGPRWPSLQAHPSGCSPAETPCPLGADSCPVGAPGESRAPLPNSGSPCCSFYLHAGKTAPFRLHAKTIRNLLLRASPESNSCTHCFEESLRVVWNLPSAFHASDSRGRHAAPNRWQQALGCPIHL